MHSQQHPLLCSHSEGTPSASVAFPSLGLLGPAFLAGCGDAPLRGLCFSQEQGRAVQAKGHFRVTGGM